jgi:hypothetical protein
MMTWMLVIFAGTFAGLNILIDIVNREPFRKVDSAIILNIKKTVVTLMTRLVRVNTIQEKELQEKLKKAHYSYQVKEYIAIGYLKMIPLACLAVFLLVNRNFLQGTILILLAYVVNNRHRKQLDREVLQIERTNTAELPELMSYITNSLRIDKDVAKIIESYTAYANPYLNSELKHLVADLKTGNIDEALLSFDLRMNIPHLSNFISAIRATLAGEYQENVLESITLDMEDFENERAKKRAAEIPGKINKAIMIVLSAMIGFDLFVLFYSVYVGVNNIV